MGRHLVIGVRIGALATFILHDDRIAITAEKIATIVEAPNV